VDVDFAALSPARAYHLMIQAIVPRPIAWVLSDHGNGAFNLAPFSYFMGITSDPPLLMISVGHKRDGTRKDTWTNIAERDDFVVHIGSAEHAAAITATAESLPHGESELGLAELETTPLAGSRLPRVVGPRIALACRRHRILELGNRPQGVIVGEIRAAWIDEAVVDTSGEHPRIDPRALDPLARLGGDDYAILGDVRTVTRPR